MQKSQYFRQPSFFSPYLSNEEKWHISVRMCMVSTGFDSISSLNLL